MDNLVNFLKFCVKRESEGKINFLNTQNNFNKFINDYKNSEIKETSKYKDIFDTIVDTHEAIINKKDESSMDYIENNYTTAKSLVLSNQQKGYNLTDDNITKLNSAAFITTAIILEATAVLSFIFMLLALVK